MPTVQLPVPEVQPPLVVHDELPCTSRAQATLASLFAGASTQSLRAMPPVPTGMTCGHHRAPGDFQSNESVGPDGAVSSKRLNNRARKAKAKEKARQEAGTTESDSGYSASDSDTPPTLKAIPAPIQPPAWLMA